MDHLALVLFLPWFLILSVLYWIYPRQPRGAARQGFDLAAMALSLVLAVAGMRWGYAYADPGAGAIWKQVLATLVAYGVFLLVLLLAMLLRRALFRAR